MALVLCGIVLMALASTGVCDNWFKGCYSDSVAGILRDGINFSYVHTVAECAGLCDVQGFTYSGVQWAEGGDSKITDAFRCACLNISTENIENCSQQLSSSSGIPVSSSLDLWAVYDSEGPYLMSVTIATDSRVAIVDTPVSIEIQITRATAANVTQDDSELGHTMDVRWNIEEDSSSFHVNLTMRNFTQILHRPKHVFTKPGNYTIDVEVSNGISSKHASLDLEIVYPAPRDLQIAISDDLDLPSCIPDKFKVTDTSGQVFAVFVDTLFQLEAAVSMGTNMTFTFWFEDTNEIRVFESFRNCTMVKTEYVFEEMGTYDIFTSVENVYGRLEKYVTVVVIERQLNSLTFDLDPESLNPATIGQPVYFTVSMVTTSRSNRYLQIWYGDGTSNTVSLEDTKSPRLVLEGDGKEVDIVASYGDGCCLLVEFQYNYVMEGLFQPKVSVFDKYPETEQSTKDGKIDIDMLESHTIGVRKFSGNQKYSEKIQSDHSPYELPLERYLGLFENSSSSKNSDSALSDERNKNTKVEAKPVESSLPVSILVLSEIKGMKLHTYPVGRCNEPMEIHLQISTFVNISLQWFIYKIIDLDEGDDEEASHLIGTNGAETLDQDTDLKLVYELNSTDTRLLHTFGQVGAYLITVKASNAVSFATASVNIVVQCPIGKLNAECSAEFIETGSEVTCRAHVLRGSSVAFYWSIEGFQAKTYVQYKNFTSTIKHKFRKPGVYDISVGAMNNISRSNLFEIEPSVHVMDPIKEIRVFKKTHNVLGNLTEIRAMHYPKNKDLYVDDIKFEFDFGFGRGNFPCDKHVCWKECWVLAERPLCMGQAGYQFKTLGAHEVTVYASNKVSEVEKTVVVHVYDGLGDVTVTVLNKPIAGSPTRFMVLKKGKTMETSDVYFTWKFSKDAGVYFTTAPLAETVFNNPGNYTVLVNITNPVDLKFISIPVYIRSRTEDDLELIHDLYVTPQTEVTFDLKGALISWDKLHVSYTDGNAEVYNVPTYNTFRFSHMFYEAGVQHVNVTLVGTQEATIETLTSYLVVQEPVTGLKLTGPTALAFQEYDSGTWTASIKTGTNVLYRWTLGETYLVTTPEFEMQIPPSGNYAVHVEAYNDVTDPPLQAFLPVLVQNVIHYMDVDIHGNLVGKPSNVKVTVNGSKQEYENFVISVDYGDGDSETFEYSVDLVAMEMEMDDIDLDLDPFDFFHIYETPGEYNVTVNLSNSVSSVVAMEIFTPIEDIHITARSPQVIRTPGHVVVKATVTGGSDLTYAWNFMDTFEETLVTSYPNQTSIAKHPYGLSGNYCVTFTVMGRNYPSPGISVKLPDCFLVVDPIDTVKLFANPNSSALEGNKTAPVVFTARSSGSHVVFIFDFGDGTIKKQHGTLLSHMTVNMTMFAEVSHVYTAVGQYKVRVTASNPLGNHSVDLASLFWVQVPPTDLRFCEAMKNNSMFTGYSGKVGETVTMCVDIVAGTNVSFDWKLGDQTDLVQQGRIVSHKYMSAGDKTVYVVARNRVHSISKSIRVHINYEIQGVELIPQHTVVAAGQEILFTAVVRPDHPNITTHYLWSFRSPTRPSIRGSSGGRGNYWDSHSLPSKQNPVPHTFLVPGQSSATVTAVNHISKMSSASVDIYVYEKIEFSEINILGDKTMRLVNKPIRFKYYAYRGTDVNLTWSFDDGTDSVFTLMSEVEHTFTREGAFNITLLVRNPVSKQTVHKMLFVLHKSYCNEPKVTLSCESGLKIVHSRQFTIEADVEPDCNLTSIMAYHWTVDGHVTQLPLETKKKVLVLPPKSMNYGNHTIEFQVDMIGTIVSMKESTTVEVVPSGLVSMIQGGVFRRQRGGAIFVMDGSDSYDPDDIDSEKLKFEWKCSYVTDDGNHGNTCFHDKTTQNALTTITHNASCPSVAMDTSVLRLHSDCLVAASNYTFDLTVYAEGRRNGTSYQTISFEKEAPDVLNVRIVRPFSKVDPVNADRKISFYVDCSNCRQNGTLYQWRIKYLTGYNIHNYARAHDYPCVEADGKTYQALKLNLTAKDSDEKPATAGNQSVITGILEDNSYDYFRMSESGAYDPDTTSVTEMSTENPLLPYEGFIQEGKPSDVKNRRRRRQILTDEEEEEEHVDSFPKVTENSDNTRRTKTSPLGENINAGRGRVVQRFPQIEEGTPGESGSSGGRQYVFDGKVEDRYGVIDPFDQNKQVPEGSGLSLDNLDKVVGEPNRKPLELDLPMVLNYLPAEKTRTGLDGETLVIKPGFLRQGLTYFVEVKVIDEERGLQGEAISSFVMNESPVFGKCSIKPDVGVEMETEFSILCKEWKDDHQPLMYEVSFSRDHSEERVLVYRGVNNRLMFKLPAGKPDRHFKVNVYIDILDALLAKTSVCSLAIEVTPKTVNDGLGGERNLSSSSRLIYEEIADVDGALRKSVDAGKDAMSKVYITYLGTWLNSLHDSANSTSSSAAYSIENSNATCIHETIVDWEEEEEYSRAARTELLRVLHELPVRDEAEVLQSARALAVTTAVYDQLDLSGLDLALKILKSVCSGALSVYKNDIVPDENVLQLAVSTMSSVVMGTMGMVDSGDRTLQYLYKQMIQEALDCIERLVLNELKFHVAREEPIESSTKHLAILAARHPVARNQSLSIGKTRFKLPSMLWNIGDSIVAGNQPTNQACMQSHMTTFKMNPYGMQDRNKVHSIVGGLNLYDCQGRLLSVDNLKEQDRIQIDLPNLQPKAVVFKNITLQKWSMNIHQFNVSSTDLDHALHFLIEFVPISQGRLFPVTVLLSVSKPPSPEYYKRRYDFEPGENTVDIFLPAGTLNGTGMYYIGIVDSTYNKGRPRQGEVTERNYTLKLWWGQCLYWSSTQEAWLPDGCQITQDSKLEVTKCTCDHLTSFGGSPHRNPVTLTLVSVVLVLYCVALFCCYHADLHDSKKGGIVYLLDNSPMDQQKFEITVETGFWRGAGTSAKISIILHGEEGMSETRELISEDDRPMFERNSRDKFILSLPDSIGRIWKVQVWHNNFGPSPSWYLNRVIVRDLNSGSQYLFICEKWLAVEEQDGKVEREFMVQDGALLFGKAYMAKAVEYMSDFHIWISLVTCPPYSSFMRTERLTVCLTMLMTYMCLNALWYKTTVTEYRGEFGLLDVSWRNLTVGAICCAVIIPLGGLLEFLFRRSKPKHASNCQSKDEVADWEPDYPSGKPNEQESEDSSEHVQPIMTYSLLDQSILNWPNIQTWAQKQWIKRQATGRSVHESNSGNSSNHSGHHGSNGSTGRQGVKPEDLLTLHTQGLSELDQASSGFEDCSSLIRPKASVDSTHTTAAPSVNESTIVHKPQSLPDSLRISTKLTSESDYEKTSKAPSVSSSGSHKSSVLHERKKSRILQHLYLPYWCRYLAWSLCAVICVGCATVTIMYGYRFGITKSTLWLQSLYFSIMISVFIVNPLLILVVVCYAAWVYKNNPTSLDHYSYDIFNREKAKQDLIRWKKQLESWDEGEALERGVAARQRSRYLRFARPPQEKQLIEARKRVLKEKKALTMFSESLAFAVSLILLLIMAYSKSGIPAYRLNLAVRTTFLRPGGEEFSKIQTRDDWYRWAQTTLLDAASKYSKLHDKNKTDSSFTSAYMIGQIQLRQQRIQEVPCQDKLMHLHGSCLSNSVTMETGAFGNVLGLSYTDGFHGDFMFGKHGVYDGTGFILSLNNSRKEGYMQLNSLREHGWLDRHTRAVFVELTLYNPPTNLFTAVRLLAEMSSTGSVFTSVKVTSTQLFRYVIVWDGILLNSELLFFILMMLLVKSQMLQILAERQNYFYSLWNIINFLLAVISVVYCGCFVYRFVIVADIVENLRSTYYEKYISVAFITFWDELLRSAVGILLFLSCVKCLRLLRFNEQFAVFGDVYRRARREIIVFLAVFCVILAAYTSLGHMLFGSMVMTFRDLWSSVMGVTAVLAGSYVLPEFHSQGQTTAARLYIFSACVFGTGFFTAYMIAVLSYYFKSRKRRRLLAMGCKETIVFYWQQLEFWTGLKKPRIEEEPVVILPPEFTMAEIEYQVDELLFRMNALTGSHGLPEKPPCYLTDSDCTYGAGDDGISSAGSEAGMNYIEDRLEQRVQKIEDNLCSQEPFLAQLLKFDSIGAKDLTQEREKQLRSHLELEIFRQLQIQRQDFKTPAEESTNKGDNSDQPAADEKAGKTAPHSPGQVSTSSDEMGQKPAPPPKPSKPRRTRSSLKVQTLEDLIAKTAHEFVDCHDNSSSNPDSPRDKLAFAKLLKAGDGVRKFPFKQHSSSSSSEKISPDLSHCHMNSSEMETIKKPTKPTFLHSRESSLSDAPKGSPNLKLRTSGLDKGGKSDLNPTGLPESSSGSEQDSLQLGKKLFGRRSLRKTRSRGKGKGPDSLEPALVLDEVEWEEAESFRVEVDKVVESTGEVDPLLDIDCVIQEVTSDRPDVQEYVVTADVHHSQS